MSADIETITKSFLVNKEVEDYKRKKREDTTGVHDGNDRRIYNGEDVVANLDRLDNLATGDKRKKQRN